MAIPKKIKKTLNMYPPVKNQGHYPSGYNGYTTPERREQLADFITKDGTFLPKSVLHADLDLGMLEFVKTELQTVLNGEEIPVMDKILTIQRWGEFASDWKFVDQDENVKLPFVSVIRQPEVQYGTNPSLQYTIPNRKTFHYVKVPTWDGTRKGVDLYKIPQPVPVDMVYEIKVVCNRMRDLNQFNRTVLQKFTSRQAYTFVKGHYIPIILESVSDESQISDLESRRYYLQTYKLQLQGFLIDEEEFEVMPAITRAMTMMELDEPIVRRNYDTICDSEDEAYPGAGSGCIDPSAADYNNTLQFDCSGVQGGVDYSCCCYNAGCQDPTAFNYVSGTCFSATCCYVAGCTDPLACNYSGACFDDGSCFYNPGCTNPAACNYSSGACSDDGSCCLDYGCMDPAACNYDSTVCCPDDSCCYISGCTDPLACNYLSPWWEWTSDSCSGLIDAGAFYTVPGVDEYSQGVSIFASGWQNTIGSTIKWSHVYDPPLSDCPTHYCCVGEPGNVTGAYQVGRKLKIVNSSGAPSPPGSVFLALSGNTYDTWTDLITAINGTGILPVIITPSMDAIALQAIFFTHELGTQVSSHAGALCECNGMVIYSACCDDGSCCYLTGCMDPEACDYEPQACCSGDCCYITGCMDPLACNYLSGACCGDFSCCYIEGCMDPSSINYNPEACCPGECCFTSGCTDPAACNYVSGSCFPTDCCYVTGCTDPTACNYLAPSWIGIADSCSGMTDEGLFPLVSGVLDYAQEISILANGLQSVHYSTFKWAMSYNIPISECPPTSCCTGEPGNVTGVYFKGMRIRLISTCYLHIPPICAGTVYEALSGTSYNTWTDLITAINGTGILPVTITPSMDAVAVAAIFWANEPGTAFDFDLGDYAESLCNCEEMITYSACCDVGCCYVTGCTDPSACDYLSGACCPTECCYITGCTDPSAINYNPEACCDVGCCYISGCTDSAACNYVSGSCFPTECCYISGCTDPYACNYVADSCCPTDCCYGRGCTNPLACNYLSGTCCDCNSDPIGTFNPGWSACCCTVEGCTDSDACNYNPGACCDDSSCCYITGCTDPVASNYVSGACCDDCSCVYTGLTGCFVSGSCNYNSFAKFDCNGQPIGTFNPGWSACCCNTIGCTDPLACDYVSGACCSCDCCYIEGCTDPAACNYLSGACCDDGSCYIITGCTDPSAIDYNPGACYDCNGDPIGTFNDGWSGCCCYIGGCPDPLACNYNWASCADDGTCCFVTGCTDPSAANYDPDACCDDCSCEYDSACVDEDACNYNPDECCDGYDCCYFKGCMDNYPGAWPDIDGNGSDGLPCTWPCVFGYNVYNFDPKACCSCDCCYYQGCTDPTATNYTPLACADCNGEGIDNPGYVADPGWNVCCTY